MPQCLVESCGNYYGKTRGEHKVIYHMLPSNLELQKKWVELCTNKSNAKVNSYARVCSEHFSDSCYRRDLQHELLGLPLRRKLKTDALPDRNLPRDNLVKIPMRSSIRIAKRKSIEFFRLTMPKTHSDDFTDKIKFMSKLLLKFQHKENISLPTYDLGLSLTKIQEMQTDNSASR